MSIHHLLVDFSLGAVTPLNATTPAEIDLLDSFENGYKAGWDDAILAKSDESEAISAELGQNLRDISFTYHEAKVAVLSEVAPVIEQAVMTVLPEIARSGFARLVAEHVTDLSAFEGSPVFEVRVCPAERMAVMAILEDGAFEDLKVLAHDTLAPGQAQLRIGNRERHIDMTEITNSMAEVFAGFASHARREAHDD
jgi:flagellar assembly protein FliH